MKHFNSPPSLNPLTNYMVNVNGQLVITNFAVDPDGSSPQPKARGRKRRGTAHPSLKVSLPDITSSLSPTGRKTIAHRFNGGSTAPNAN